MHLSVLLDEARNAGPLHRIEWRDPIASYGERAIAAVQPWLVDPVLGSFAIRVIERVGEQGKAEQATRALRAARGLVPPPQQGDLDWALGRLRPITHPASAKTCASEMKQRRVGERPRLLVVARRRAR